MKSIVFGGKFEIDRHRDQAGAHDAEIGGEIFGAVGRKDGDAVAALEAASRCSARATPFAMRVERGIAELARLVLAAEIDDRDLRQIAVAADQMAEIRETRTSTLVALPTERQATLLEHARRRDIRQAFGGALK